MFGDNPVYYICENCGGSGVIEIEGGFTVGLCPDGLVPTWQKRLGTVGEGIDYSVGMNPEGDLVPAYYEREFQVCELCMGSGLTVEIDLE